MSRQLVSSSTITALLNYMSDYQVLRSINDTFTHAGISINEDHQSRHVGQRRTLADQYIASLDLTNERDAKKLVAVFEEALTFLAANAENDLYEADRTKMLRSLTMLKNCLSIDGWTFRDGKVVLTNSAFGLSDVDAAAKNIDADYILNQVKRLQDCVESDAEAAIGGAKELIESCCNTILTDHQVQGINAMDVSQLIKETKKVLKLTPEDVPETTRGKNAMNSLLGSLTSIAASLAELRNEYGTGHGKHGKTKRPKARHARLAVGCAATLVTFLLETHIIQRTNKTNQ